MPSHMSERAPVQVAVVGSGMAGLVTAWLLHREPRRRFVVKLFESGHTLSLDSASVSIPNNRRSSTDRVDLPMRAFAGGYYNNLKDMYDFLGIQYRSQPFLFEFAKVGPESARQQDDQDGTSYFLHASNFHQREPRPKAVATLAYAAELLYLLACYTWFTICCFVVPPRHAGRSETLGEYLWRIWIPDYFVTYYILPLISSVATCPHQSLLAFPASDVIDYKKMTYRAPHYTVSNGVQTVQDKLVRGIDYELQAAVTAVEPLEHGVRVTWKKTDGQSDAPRSEYFDRVILAVAPDIVGRIFAPLQYHMARIPTTQVESVVHTDRRNVEEHSEKSKHDAQLIYLRTSTGHIPQTESLHVQDCGVVVTTCPSKPIDPSFTIHSAKFTRVLRSDESRRIVNSIFGDTPDASDDEKKLPIWRNGDDNVWLAGGWCWDGMVLLEGCIVSAMRIADAFNVEVPWRNS